MARMLPYLLPDRSGTGPGLSVDARRTGSMASVLWLITILLVVLWVLGYAVNIGAWVNFLLVVAVILLVINLISALMRRPRYYD